MTVIAEVLRRLICRPVNPNSIAEYSREKQFSHRVTRHQEHYVNHFDIDNINE